MKIRMPLYVFLHLRSLQILSIRKIPRQYALLPYLLYRKSTKAKVDLSPRKFKKTRPYHENIDGLCRRRYPSLYKEKKKEDRTENKSHDFRESISEKQNRNKECCRTFLYILAFSRSCSIRNPICGTSCCRIDSARNLKSRKLGTPSG